uniref:protein kinase domain-containing protein n=1 Tax=Oculatella sp. LEGE 06141 TaxID=1828648 RepID=UPI0018810B5B|nr:serine/threonine protein kinase [Oculatella sp. LEGE 06141]
MVTHPAVHCINPECSDPYPQSWGNKFCQSCGSPLLLQKRYLPLRRIGSGGFAVTYTVYDVQSNIERVLKVLVDQAPKAVELFEQEAQVLASLNHPGVPTVEPHSFFRVPVGNPVKQTLPCLVMEKIDGETLEDVLEKHPQGCPEADVVNWLYQSVEILQTLHQRQIVHRDLKPANLMQRQGLGQLVMIDFGGAKQMQPQRSPSASSTRLVSPGYSPPEQRSGSAVQPASDFYALGRTMIHLLTGRYPADLEDPLTGELKWRSVVSVNPALADLLDDLTRADLAKRPATAAEVRSRLQQFAPLPAALSPTQRVATQLRLAQRQLMDAFKQEVARFRQGAAALTTIVARIVVWTVKAAIDTAWGTVLAGIGGGVGATIGFILAYSLPFGGRITTHLSQYWAELAPDAPLEIGSGFLLFALAGAGTAIGLTLSGSFRQRRRFFWGSLMGLVGYVLG